MFAPEIQINNERLPAETAMVVQFVVDKACADIKHMSSEVKKSDLSEFALVHLEAVQELMRDRKQPDGRQLSLPGFDDAS